MSGSIKVWDNPAGIANIISLKMVKSMLRVTYNSNDRGVVFIVHIHKGIMEFVPHPKGLHNLDLDQYKEMMMTVKDNYEGHTKYEIKKPTEARKLQRIMGHPLERNFE